MLPGLGSQLMATAQSAGARNHLARLYSEGEFLFDP
jgi:hypothetical protein